jgi:hypothetical protein
MIWTDPNTTYLVNLSLLKLCCLNQCFSYINNINTFKIWIGRVLFTYPLILLMRIAA